MRACCTRAGLSDNETAAALYRKRTASRRFSSGETFGLCTLNIYEDADKAADTSELGLLKRNKRLVITAVASALAYGVMNHTSV